MFIINVKNRWDAAGSSAAIKDRTAIISVRDPAQSRPEFAENDSIVDVLRLTFSDVLEGEPDCVNVFHAKAIRQFLEKNAGRIERLTVHCTFGQHRSGAIAAAILKVLSGDETLFHHEYISPNPFVYELVKKELEAAKEQGVFNGISCRFEENPQ